MFMLPPVATHSGRAHWGNADICGARLDNQRSRQHRYCAYQQAGNLMAEPTPEMYRNAGELVYKMCARIARDKAVAETRARLEAEDE
jgi:hypothetical protein